MQILSKTQNFKPKILPLGDCESDIIISPESVTLFDNDRHIDISFTFDAYYLFDGWVHLSYYNFTIPPDTKNEEEIKNFIKETYCTIEDFNDYFSDSFDAIEYSG
jgi:hypothetical protein